MSVVRNTGIKNRKISVHYKEQLNVSGPRRVHADVWKNHRRESQIKWKKYL